MLNYMMMRADGTASVFKTVCLPPTAAFASLNELYVERIVKFLLWARGGDKVRPVAHLFLFFVTFLDFRSLLDHFCSSLRST